MNRRKGGSGILILFVIAFLLVITVISAFTKDDPVDITAHFGCIGGSTCLVGELLKVDVKLNNHEASLLNRTTQIKFSSDAILKDETTENILIGNEAKFSIPLKLSLKEGKYKVEVTSDVIKAGGWFDQFMLSIKYGILRFHKYSYAQEVTIRYPDIEVQLMNQDYCTEDGLSFDEIKLKLEDNKFNEFTCKIRIYTNKLVSTSHPLLIENRLSNEFHYYETNFSSINKKDLTGAIQKVSFIADPAVDQVETNIVPVCLITDNEVEIEKYAISLKKCKVNRNNILERILP